MDTINILAFRPSNSSGVWDACMRFTRTSGCTNLGTDAVLCMTCMQTRRTRARHPHQHALAKPCAAHDQTHSLLLEQFWLPSPCAPRLRDFTALHPPNAANTSSERITTSYHAWPCQRKCVTMWPPSAVTATDCNCCAPQFCALAWHG